MSTLHNHHVQLGSQQAPWLRSGDYGCTCGFAKLLWPSETLHVPSTHTTRGTP